LTAPIGGGFQASVFRR